MDAPLVELVRLRDQTLREFCGEIMRGLGVPEPHARVVSDSLVAANLRGVDSHGVDLLPSYIGQLRAGGVDGKTAGAVAMESGVCLLYDGQNGLGHVVSDRCTDHALRLVRAGGLAMVVARNSHHFGAAAYWGQKLADAGYIGIAMSSAGPSVPPWPGKSGRLGTNPICMAVPGGRWLLDMATTTTAMGKLANAVYYHQATIPASWGFMDPDGNPTTDRDTALRGFPSPLGGYKGSGLAMMVEILCSGLSGSLMASEVPRDRTGIVPLRISHMFMAIDPGKFMPRDEFEDRIGRLVSMMKSSEPVAGQGEVLVAGEPEWRTQEQRLREGIPLPVPLWSRLSTIARQVNVTPPEPDALG